MWNFSEIWYTYSFYIYSTKIIRNQSIEHRKEKKRKESDGKWKTKKFLSFDWPVFRGQSFWQSDRKRNFRAMKIKEQIARMLPRKQNRVLERIQKIFIQCYNKRKKERKFSFVFKISKMEIQTILKCISSFIIHFVNLILYSLIL